MLNLHGIVLASASPRRREMLGLLGVDHLAFSPQIEERRLPHETPDEYVLRNALMKAEDVAARHRDDISGHFVLASDTVVVAPDGEVLEKPQSAVQAENMLKRLSSRVHSVVSGYALLFVPYDSSAELLKLVCRSCRTEVEFAALTSDLIKRYVATGDPLDKAGAYGIQSLGAVLVKEVRGSYTNVVGLPLNETMQLLTDLCHVREYFNPTPGAQRPRAPDQTVAISKLKDPACIRLAHHFGQRKFGENYAQELARKAEELSDLADLEWHYTGRLQSGRLADVAKWAHAVHSVESPDKAKQLDQACQKAGRHLEVYLKMEISPLTTASRGCPWNEAQSLLQTLQDCSHLSPAGFMGIGPIGADERELSQLFYDFAIQAKVSWEAAGQQPSRLSLSLGMSGDAYVAEQAADQAGLRAPLCRIGTQIFGERPTTFTDEPKSRPGI